MTSREVTIPQSNPAPSTTITRWMFSVAIRRTAAMTESVGRTA